MIAGTAPDLAGGASVTPRLAHFHSTECGEVVATLSRLFAPHEMLLCEPKQNIDAAIRFLQLPSGAISEICYGAAVKINSAVPSDRYMLHLVTAGESHFEVPGGKVSSLRPGMLHLSPPGDPLRIHFGRESRHLTASLAANTVNPAGLSEANRARAWRGLLDLIFAWAELGIDKLAHSAPHFDALIGDFFAGPQRDVCTEAAHSGAAPWYVARARRLMAQQISAGRDEIHLTDIAAEVGVSVRTLQLGFQRFSGRSFLEELRAQRLAELDRRLVEAEPGEDVTTIMQACGIVSMGRFAGYYRARYGALPSRRLRYKAGH